MISEWLRRWQKTNPLAVLALAAAVGLMLADWLRLRPSFWLVGLGIAALVFASWRPRWWKFVPLAVAVFCLWHAMRLAETHANPLRERLLKRETQTERVAVRARLYPWLQGVQLDAARAGAEVMAVRWEGTDDFVPMRASVRVALPPGVALKEPGIYEVEGDVTLPRPPMNPGQFDSAGYSLRMGWAAVLKAEQMTLVETEPFAAKFHLLNWAEMSRQWMMRALSAGIETEQAAGQAVVLAMALGASSEAGDEVEEAFRNSGTLHVFAVSGLHVVVLAMVAGFLLRWLGLGKGGAALAVIAFVFFYAYVTGWRPSAARAAFMIAFVLGAPLLNRQTALQNSLGAAALVLFLMDSHQFFTPGFQLSFGVLWAIAIAAGWLMDKTRPWTDLDPFLPPVLANRPQRGAEFGRRWMASLGSVSTAAWAGSLPLVLGHFQTVTPVALLANCVLVPMSSICIILSCTSLSFAGMGFSFGQERVNGLNACLANAMVHSAKWFAELPLAHFHVDLRRQRRAPVDMRVFQLQGGGAANHIRCGKTQWLLDCGNANEWRWVMQPYLRSEGINRLHGLILSHGDASHVGAAPRVLKTMHVEQLHTSRTEPWKFDPPFSSLRQLSLITPPDGEVWRRHNIGEQLLLGEGVTATVLHPRTEDLYEKADDRGLVLMLQVGGIQILWLGDAGFMTEKKLLERASPLRCDLLIRNQHSADVSGLPELLLAARPQAVISSNDAWLAEERMPERLRVFCAQEGMTLFDMGTCGSVGISFTGSEARLEAFANGQKATVRPLRPDGRRADK
ncbi:MAG TPA: ComEC/Rec2 family competence protein [Prosthecobacter sp.]|nr:ComEC/Rec2 family competence protein [Prosthecobacter sp.]